MPPVSRPPFDSLPLRASDPAFSAWTLYGDEDQLGTLNLLTAENTLAAAKSEIRTGIRLSLDPPLNVLRVPGSDRAPLKHTIYRRGGRPVHDDVLEFNTQIGAQWDGLRHVSYIKLAKFYNGVSVDQISGSNAEGDILGTNAWVKSGSIAGRGVLLDYYSWAQNQGKTYTLIGDTADYAITVLELQACAQDQGVSIQDGDILFVRSGFWVGYNALSEKDKLAWSYQKSPTWVGVETTRRLAQWLWNSGIAACAGDAPGWERIPNYNSPPEAGLEGWSLHEIMLSGWGMPIGEMFDLEALSEECKRQNRWSFFVTSAPLHVIGGVGSPPNIIAIF